MAGAGLLAQALLCCVHLQLHVMGMMPARGPGWFQRQSHAHSGCHSPACARPACQGLLNTHCMVRAVSNMNWILMLLLALPAGDQHDTGVQSLFRGCWRSPPPSPSSPTHTTCRAASANLPFVYVQVMGMIPGFNANFMGAGGDKQSALMVKRYITIIESMTDKELDSTNVKIFAEQSRILRLARGSGGFDRGRGLLKWRWSGWWLTV